jgi:protein gp37
VADNTKIEWTDASWSPITGCTPISPGCRNCYARRMSRRLAGRHGYPEAPHHFDVTFHPDKLDKPLHWKKPRTVFVCSMSDIAHEDVPLAWIEPIFKIMQATPQHTYQILTKRLHRLEIAWRVMCQTHNGGYPTNPLTNVWLGATAENQEQWNKRVSILRQIPAAVRFVSVEPMLEAINCFDHCQDGCTVDDCFYCSRDAKGIDWVIAGAETGPGARPMDLNWARNIRDQCQAAGVPFFFKRDSAGNRELDGRLWEEMPSES